MLNEHYLNKLKEKDNIIAYDTCTVQQCYKENYPRIYAWLKNKSSTKCYTVRVAHRLGLKPKIDAVGLDICVAIERTRYELGREMIFLKTQTKLFHESQLEPMSKEDVNDES